MKTMFFCLIFDKHLNLQICFHIYKVIYFDVKFYEMKEYLKELGIIFFNCRE